MSTSVRRFNLALLFLCAASFPATAREDAIRFQSEVSSGQSFRESIGHGLVLILSPLGGGWIIGVSPQTVTEPDCRDFAWVVNPPFRAYNALYLNAAYGMTAQDAVNRSPREFNFVLSCAACKRESTFLRRAIESTPVGMGTSPQGHGKLWIVDHKTSPAPAEIDGVNHGQIDWIRFRVEIRFPENADSLPVSNDFEQPDIPRHELTGTVRDALTREPIAGAKVAVSAQEPALGQRVIVSTGADGRFAFTDIAEGPVNVTVEKSGYVSSVLGPSGNDIEIRLMRLSTIAGRVVGDGGKPLAGVFVYLTFHDLIDGRRIWRTVTGQAVTDNDGVYSFPELRPGQYLIHTLLHRARSEQGGLPGDLYLPQYYPNTADFDSAARLELRGQDVQADFTLSRGPVFPVTGHVSGLLHPNAFSCQFADSAGQAMGGGWHYDPGTARFTLLMPAGTWTIWCDGTTAKPPDYATVHVYAARQITVDAGISEIELELRRPIDIPINENVVRLTRVDPPTAGLAPEPEIRRVPPGTYRVTVAPGTCTASVVSGNIDLLRDDLIVKGGDRPAAIRVTRYPKCPTLGGTVHSLSGNAWGSVVALADSEHIQPAILPVHQGQFDATALMPGTYRVYAFRTLEGLEYANPDALREFRGQTIRLEKDRPATVNLELIERP